MASECLPMLQFDAIRVTRENICGVPQDSACAYATTQSAITLTLTEQYQDAQEYLRLNGQGVVCVYKRTERQLLGTDFELTICNVDPEMVNLFTSEALVLSDNASPVAIGWNTTRTAPLTSFFGLEAWVNTGEDCPGGVRKYGYMVLPRGLGATAMTQPLENGNIDLTITGRLRDASPWGLGPYNVRIIEAVLDLGEPAPLLTAILGTQFRRQFWTALGPPPTICGCQDLTPSVVVLPLAATAATLRTMTIPLDTNGVSLPGYIDWGDVTPSALVAAGATTATHTYAVGSYTATFRTTAYSAPTWTSASITAS